MGSWERRRRRRPRRPARDDIFQPRGNDPLGGVVMPAATERRRDKAPEGCRLEPPLAAVERRGARGVAQLAAYVRRQRPAAEARLRRSLRKRILLCGERTEERDVGGGGEHDVALPPLRHRTTHTWTASVCVLISAGTVALESLERVGVGEATQSTKHRTKHTFSISPLGWSSPFHSFPAIHVAKNPRPW